MSDVRRSESDEKVFGNQYFTSISRAARLSVAPMMDWTTPECRLFHRIISKNALLYTEMVTAPALIHGDRGRHLDYHDIEHPVALQLGGSVPEELAQAVKIASDWNYDEINLNCGCPSDRVQSGAFGAVLMKSPDLVADCVAAMQAAAPVEVTVKCRIGVDDQDPNVVLPEFLRIVSAAGVTRFTIHARKAWLQGLSPKDNRTIPPLDYALVYRMRQEFPQLHLSINGGVTTLAQAQDQLKTGLDGVMVGRAAYHDPMAVLGAADQLIWDDGVTRDPFDVAQDMVPYIADHLQQGGRLHHYTRHMLGLFHGRAGARKFRQILSQGATRDGADVALFETAVNAVRQAQEHDVTPATF
ncbi:tRNA dihydrouridine(20/20a) synthase DusA [Thioclava sp. SK-1]|uniref:tRNA dihydrouridine(20/20a) synthase DusA n=1 Tax=Thioclava sp. SK-1 TaxID=1889770 RepID=UPI000826D3CF|nr:tRNA dihydrouridine(20/20a) synthase DusA [Thioclava sp. SK-1]OCX67000.1 tRNA dihydrouridine(20/20a) synthase DusA [Thioclava sp. SK-1]